MLKCENSICSSLLCQNNLFHLLYNLIRVVYVVRNVMMLHQAIRKAKSGDVVEVLATDPSTSWDIPKFCMHLGHELLLKEEVLDEQNHKEYRYLVQKG